MTEAKWPFSDVVRWLRTKSESLNTPGATVELDVQEVGRATIRLRIERGGLLGEVTIWGGGAAHMAIVNLQSGEFVFERDDVYIDDSTIDAEFREFFDRMGEAES